MNIDSTDPNWKDFNYYYNLDTKIQDNYISNIKMQIVEQQQKIQELELKQLFEFLENWKSKYDVFCHEFNCYTYTESIMPIWSCNSPIEQCGYFTLSKSEFYIDEFFNMILDKRAKFELQENMDRNSYNYLDSNLRQYDYAMKPNVTKIISSDKFIMSWQEKNYRLDIKLNSALICSLLVAISNNYIIYDWYSKQSRFKGFISNISNDFNYLTFEFNKSHSRVKLCGKQGMVIDIDTSRGWFYVILGDEIVRAENKLYYTHLDKIFGKDRTKPLTEEDIQLYSILNEGRKPKMYDFEY